MRCEFAIFDALHFTDWIHSINQHDKGTAMLNPLFALVILLLSVGTAQANDAFLCGQEDACPLRLLAPVIATPVACESEAQTVTYTVENDVFDVVELALDIEPIIPDDTSPGSTVVFDTDASSCFDTVPPSVPARDIFGPGTCTLVVVITPTDCEPDDFPELIARELIVMPFDIAQAPMTALIEVDVLERIPFLAIAVAAGSVSDGSLIAATSPLVVHDATGTWNLVTSGLSAGHFQSATCTGFDASGICIAGGFFPNPNAILNNSTDGGQTWGTPNITPSFPTLSNIESVACTDEGSSAICSAVGFSLPFSPLMYRSTNGGADWTGLVLPPIEFGSLSNTACASNVCTAVGNNILYVAIGTIVSQVTFANDIGLFATACTQSSGKVICTAVGRDFASGNAYLLVNPDVAGTGIWTNWTTTIAGTFNATACATKNDNKVLCTAVGDVGLYVNTDVTGAGPWTFKQAGNFRSTACKTNGAQAVCTAAGQDASFEARLYMSKNGGVTWPLALASVTESAFTGTACTNSDTRIVCTVAGYICDNEMPLLYANADAAGAGTWASPLALSNGRFIGMGASGNSNDSDFGCQFGTKTTE